MSKMRKIYLPIIAGDLSKALINYADSSFTNDKTLDSSKWTIRNHGLVASVNTGDPIIFTETNPLLTNNFCEFMLRTELTEIDIDDSTFGIILRGKTDTSNWLGLRNQSTSSNKQFNLGQYGCNWGGWCEKTNDVIKTQAVNYNNDTCSIRQKGIWTTPSTAPAITSDMSGETEQTMYVLSVIEMNQKAYGALIVGEAVSSSQAEAIANALDALYDAFNV